jgi:hypothetical protein
VGGSEGQREREREGERLRKLGIKKERKRGWEMGDWKRANERERERERMCV